MIGQKIFSEKFCNSNVAGNGLFYVDVNLDNSSDIVNRRRNFSEKCCNSNESGYLLFYEVVNFDNGLYVAYGCFL